MGNARTHIEALRLVTIFIGDIFPQSMNDKDLSALRLPQSTTSSAFILPQDKKPYECKLCMKGFVRRWDFYRHVNSVHQGKWLIMITQICILSVGGLCMSRRSCCSTVSNDEDLYVVLSPGHIEADFLLSIAHLKWFALLESRKFRNFRLIDFSIAEGHFMKVHKRPGSFGFSLYDGLVCWFVLCSHVLVLSS